MNENKTPEEALKQVEKMYRDFQEMKSNGEDFSGFPEGWNKTVEDLMKDSTPYKVIGPPETEWARNYERSLIPNDALIPKEGEIYEAKCDVKAKYYTSYRAPYTGGGECTLPKGTRVEIRHINEERPILIHGIPTNYSEIEELVVAEEERNCEKYGGYGMYFKTITFGAQFRSIDT